jgi:hypothetical protein
MYPMNLRKDLKSREGYDPFTGTASGLISLKICLTNCRFFGIFTPLESPAIYDVDSTDRMSIPYRKGEVKAPSFLTGFTLLLH